MSTCLTSRACHRRLASTTRRGGGTRRREAPENVANLFAWWRADSGIVIDTGVSSWTDRRNGHVLSQAIAARQPVYSAAAATMNNQATLTFDGTNDELFSPEAASVWKFLGGDQCSVYGAYRTTAQNWNPILATENNGGGGDRSGFMLAAREAGAFTNNNWSVWVPKITSGFHATATSPAGDAPINTRSYITYHAPGGLSHIRPSFPDASPTALTVSGSQGSLDPSTSLYCGGYLPGGTFFTGAVAEIIIYSAALSAADDNAIRAYLVGRYSI